MRNISLNMKKKNLKFLCSGGVMESAGQTLYYLHGPLAQYTLNVGSWNETLCFPDSLHLDGVLLFTFKRTICQFSKVVYTSDTVNSQNKQFANPPQILSFSRIVQRIFILNTQETGFTVYKAKKTSPFLLFTSFPNTGSFMRHKSRWTILFLLFGQ